MSRAHFLEPALDLRVPWGLRLPARGTCLASQALLAGTSRTRRRGLRGTPGLAAGQAMVIAPSQGIHTFGMAFAIDVIGIARNGVIVGVRQAVPPRRIVLMWRAFAVVEMAVGAIEAAGCAIGDRVVVEAGSERDP
jgi:uncharacterized membrane protein (UPF0127 family)